MVRAPFDISGFESLAGDIVMTPDMYLPDVQAGTIWAQQQKTTPK